MSAPLFSPGFNDAGILQYTCQDQTFALSRVGYIQGKAIVSCSYLNKQLLSWEEKQSASDLLILLTSCKTLNFLTFTHTFLIVTLFIIGQFRLARHHLYHGSHPALEITATVLCNVSVTLQMKTGENISLGIMFKFSIAQLSSPSALTFQSWVTPLFPFWFF